MRRMLFYTSQSKSSLQSLVALVLVLLIGLQSNAHCSSDGNPSRDIVQANLNYEQGDYNKAIVLYHRVMDAGIDNAHIYYNMGNALYRLKFFGQAIASYRRALSQLPRDSDIKASLELARKQCKDRLESSTPVKSFWDLSLLLYPRTILSSFELELGFLIGYLLLWFSFSLTTSGVSSRALCWLIFVSVLIFGLNAFGAKDDRSGNPVFSLTPESRRINPAVVTSLETTAYSGNSTNFQPVFVLHEGSEVEVRERRENWIEVLLPNNRRGWVRIHEIEVL